MASKRAKRERSQLDLFGQAMRCETCGLPMARTQDGQRLFFAGGEMACPGCRASADLSYTMPDPADLTDDDE